jgi:hypothetical protein
MNKCGLFTLVELEPQRRVWLRAGKRRRGYEQDLALEDFAQVIRLRLGILGVDRDERNAEALADVLKNTVVGLESLDLEVRHGLVGYEVELDGDGHGAGSWSGLANWIGCARCVGLAVEVV